MAIVLPNDRSNAKEVVNTCAVVFIDKYSVFNCMGTSIERKVAIEVIKFKKDEENVS